MLGPRVSEVSVRHGGNCVTGQSSVDCCSQEAAREREKATLATSAYSSFIPSGPAAYGMLLPVSSLDHTLMDASRGVLRHLLGVPEHGQD